MKTLDLDQVELNALEQALKRCLADLEHEIGHTHHAEFKQMLRERRGILEGIARKLSVSGDPPA
ncbi:MAG: hypothetical protein NTW21_10810 [Verrucomicrobia bacterium]|nr:hypothetical protein [Verrucomicrobiota bacterium]